MSSFGTLNNLTIMPLSIALMGNYKTSNLQKFIKLMFTVGLESRQLALCEGVYYTSLRSHRVV